MRVFKLALLPLLLAQPTEALSIAQEVQAATAFLAGVPHAQDVRMVSLRAVPAKDRELRRKTLNFWLNNLSFEPDPELLRDVPGTGGQLLWFHLPDYGWNADAWGAVADREPYYVEPVIPSPLANLARGMIGRKQTKAYSLQLIVRADWLFRESVESDRSPTYYDLLFAKDRFRRQPTPGFHKDARFFDAPLNEADWDKAFGVDTFEAFFKRTGINLKRGAVVDERSSIVAFSNRLLERVRTPIGYRWKTFDVKEASGKKDFAETLNEGFEFDAGELIAALPNGGQAYLLVNNKGAILEFADPRVARDTSDPSGKPVRNPGSCVVCHERGLIEPKNLVADLLKDGIDIHFKDKRKARDARSFFLHWQRELKADQDGYVEFVQKTSGLKPAENVAAFRAFRDWYDAPVDADQAARECGVPLDLFKVVAARSPRVRLLQLVQGQKVPRSTWAGDNLKNRGMHHEFMLLYRAGEPYR